MEFIQLFAWIMWILLRGLASPPPPNVRWEMTPPASWPKWGCGLLTRPRCLPTLWMLRCRRAEARGSAVGRIVAGRPGGPPDGSETCLAAPRSGPVYIRPPPRKAGSRSIHRRAADGRGTRRPGSLQRWWVDFSRRVLWVTQPLWAGSIRHGRYAPRQPGEVVWFSLILWCFLLFALFIFFLAFIVYLFSAILLFATLCSCTLASL